MAFDCNIWANINDALEWIERNTLEIKSQKPDLFVNYSHIFKQSFIVALDPAEKNLTNANLLDKFEKRFYRHKKCKTSKKKKKKTISKTRAGKKKDKDKERDGIKPSNDDSHGDKDCDRDGSDIDMDASTIPYESESTEILDGELFEDDEKSQESRKREEKIEIKRPGQNEDKSAGIAVDETIIPRSTAAGDVLNGLSIDTNLASFARENPDGFDLDLFEDVDTSGFEGASLNISEEFSDNKIDWDLVEEVIHDSMEMFPEDNSNVINQVETSVDPVLPLKLDDPKSIESLLQFPTETGDVEVSSTSAAETCQLIQAFDTSQTLNLFESFQNENDLLNFEPDCIDGLEDVTVNLLDHSAVGSSSDVNVAEAYEAPPIKADLKSSADSSQDTSGSISETLLSDNCNQSTKTKAIAEENAQFSKIAPLLSMLTIKGQRFCCQILQHFKVSEQMQFFKNPSSSIPRDTTIDFDGTYWQPTESINKLNHVTSKEASAGKAFDQFYQFYLERSATMRNHPSNKTRLIQVIVDLLRDSSYEFSVEVVNKIFKLLSDFGIDGSATWTKILDDGLENFRSSNFESIRLFCSMVEDHLSQSNIRLFPWTSLKLFSITTLSNTMLESVDGNISCRPPTSPNVPCSPTPKPDSSLSAYTRSVHPFFPSSTHIPAPLGHTPESQLALCPPIPCQPISPISSPYPNQLGPKYHRSIEVQSPTHSVTSGYSAQTDSWAFHLIAHLIIPVRTYKRPAEYETLLQVFRGTAIRIPSSPLISPLSDPRVIHSIVKPKATRIIRTGKAVKKKSIASNKLVLSEEIDPGSIPQSKVPLKSLEKRLVKSLPEAKARLQSQSTVKMAAPIRVPSIRQKRTNKTPGQTLPKLTKHRMRRQLLTNCQLKPSTKIKTPLTTSSPNQQFNQLESKFSSLEMKSKSLASVPDEPLLQCKEEVASNAPNSFLGRLAANEKAKDLNEDDQLLCAPRVPKMDFKDLSGIRRTINVGSNSPTDPDSSDFGTNLRAKPRTIYVIRSKKVG